MKEVSRQRHTPTCTSSLGPKTGRTTSSGTTDPSRSSSSTLTATDWIMDQKLTYEEIEKCSSNRKLDDFVDSALFLVRSVPGRRDQDACGNGQGQQPKNLDMHLSGLELWILVKYNFDRASAFHVICILESIRNMQAVQDKMCQFHK